MPSSHTNLVPCSLNIDPSSILALNVPFTTYTYQEVFIMFNASMCPLWIHGGAVRDLVDGIDPRDIDVDYDCAPSQFKTLCEDFFGSNCHWYGGFFQVSGNSTDETSPSKSSICKPKKEKKFLSVSFTKVNISVRLGEVNYLEGIATQGFVDRPSWANEFPLNGLRYNPITGELMEQAPGAFQDTCDRQVST